MMRQLASLAWFCGGGACLALLLLACAPGPVSSTGGPTAAAASKASARSPARAPDPAQAPPVAAVDKGAWWSPAVTPSPVSWLSWGEQGELQVGFEDGRLATVDVQRKAATLQALSETPSPVLAVSADGVQAMVQDDTMVLVGVRDTGIMLRMNQVPQAIAVIWSPNGDRLLVIDGENRIHVWEQIRAKNATQARTLSELMQRQTPDYSFTFPASLNGPVAYTGDNLLVLGDREGQVMIFDLHGERMAWPLFEFKAPVRRLAVGQNYIMAIDQSGKVRARITEPAKNLYWVRDRPALELAADRHHAQWVGWLDEQTLSVRAVKSGDALWERPRPAGALCGMVFDGQRERLAVCAGGVVGVFSARTGQPLAWLARDKDKVSFAQ